MSIRDDREEVFDREAELEREWEMMEEELQEENYPDEDWTNAERNSEDGWYYDDEADERDNFDRYDDEEDEED